MFPLIRRFYLMLPAVFIATAAWAETGGSLMDSVVVTGTRTERKLLDVPVRTEVISKQELVKTHARDLAEALRNQPGLLLKETHGKSGSQAWLQGLDSDRVLVLVDGRPVSASTGSSVDLSQLAVGDIDRIEIVKGAVSALYGSSAMGGVVNIITSRSKAPFAYTLVGDAGSFGNKNLGDSSDLSARHASLNLTATHNKWQAHLGADFRDRDGFDLDKSSYRFEGDKGPKYNVNVALAYQLSSGGEISFNPALYREDLQRNFSSFAPGIGEIKKHKNEEVKRINGVLSFKQPLKNDARLSGFFMYEDFEDITEQDVLATVPVDQRRVANIAFNKAEIQWDKPLGDNQLLTLGLVGFQADLTQHQQRLDGAQIARIDEIAPGADRQNIEVFVQDDIFVSDRWELLPGFRYQDDSDFGDYFAPKLNVMMTPQWWPRLETRVRFGIGRGYRVPNLKERHFLFDHSALGYMVLGNPGLIPETSDSFQVGFDMTHANGFRSELSLFHNDIDDLIDTDLNPEKSAATQLNIFEYVNVAKARTRGADLVVDYRFSPRFSANLGYSYLDAIDRSTGNHLTQRPKDQVKLGLDWRLERWKSEMSLRATYQSEEFVDGNNTMVSPDWTTLDFKFNQPLREGLTFFVGIDNLTDEHRDPLDAGEDFRPKKGRFIYLGMRLEGRGPSAKTTINKRLL